MENRVYYAINEAGARQAKQMSSFSDYIAGSRTAEYKSQVNSAYDLADKVADRKPEEAENAYKLAERYSRLLASNYNKDISISCRCPSVMISGAGNFPVRKKEKQVAAWEKNHEEYKQIQDILVRLQNMIYGTTIIKSGDQNAIEKLEEKLAKLEQSQEYMKQVNAFYRKNKTLSGCSLLSTEDRMKLTASMASSWRTDPVPFESWALSNNNQNIHSTRARLETLKAAKSNPAHEEVNENYKVIENTEIMRLQIIFDDKPDQEVRTILKQFGFKWAPSQNAWQRQLTENAKYSLRSVIDKLTAFYGSDEEELANQ